MTVFPIILPDERFRSLRLAEENRAGVAESPWTGQEQIFEHQGQLWRLEAAYPTKVGRAAAEPIIAALTSLRGKAGSFLLGDTNARTPRGTQAVEPARTNEVTNNTMAGAVVGTIGSGGALPTGWSFNNPAGATVEVVAASMDTDGIDFIEIRYHTPTVSNSAVNVRFLPAALALAAAQGDDWNSSAYVTLTAGSAVVDVDKIQLSQQTFDGVGLTLSTANNEFTPTAGALKNNRETVSELNLADPTTAFVRSLISVENLALGTLDLTLRIGLPQMEPAPSASAPIKTSAGAVTRPAGPTVFGADQTGQILQTWGWPSFGTASLLAGDYIQVGSGETQRLHKLTADIAADVEGKAALSIWPRLRESPADSAALVTSDCKGVFRLLNEIQAWDQRPGDLYDIAFAAREAI